MKFSWENEGEANQDGAFVATIDTEDGRGVQRFEGSTHKEVADKLLQAQANATKKIGELSDQVRSSIKPVTEQPIVTAQPKPLSGDDRVRLTEELKNPATAPEAVSRIIEATTGRSLKAMSEQMSADEVEDAKKQVREAAAAFQSEEPQYLFCDHNGSVMHRYFVLHNLDFRVKSNYHFAFQKLKDAKLLMMAAPALEPTPAPAPANEPPAQPERIAQPATRPRGSTASSGLRAENASGSPSAAPPKSPAKLTKLDIETMSATTYEERYRTEPEFRRIVDELYAAPARAR